MSVASVLLLGMSVVLGVLFACAAAWFLLSRWLEGRALIVASLACSIAFGIGRSSYVGPADANVLVHVIAVVLTTATAFLVGRIWLARFARQMNG
jgi:hypothetical protein